MIRPPALPKSAALLAAGAGRDPPLSPLPGLSPLAPRSLLCCRRGQRDPDPMFERLAQLTTARAAATAGEAAPATTRRAKSAPATAPATAAEAAGGSPEADGTRTAALIPDADGFAGGGV